MDYTEAMRDLTQKFSYDLRQHDATKRVNVTIQNECGVQFKPLSVQTTIDVDGGIDLLIILEQ